MKILSPAKVNLRLEVLGIRADKYHDIFSIIQPISLYDEVFLEVKKGGEGISVDCKHPQVPSNRDNLAYRAAEVFVQRTGFKGKIEIEIRKKIPVAAGLGGGSSNAAIVLKGLNDMVGEKLTFEDLQVMGKKLGADIPFFLLGKNSLATGIGEILEEIDLPKFWYVIINPGFPLSSREVYQDKNLNLTKKKVGINMPSLAKSLKNPFLIKELLYNDLEKIVFKRYPGLRDIKRLLIERGAAGSLLSGSGSTVFGLFLERGHASKAYELLLKDSEKNNWTIFLAQGL
jgi:4-diphosphocytidyl-2-C-methyl-D-erythritol kinase